MLQFLFFSGVCLLRNNYLVCRHTRSKRFQIEKDADAFDRAKKKCNNWCGCVCVWIRNGNNVDLSFSWFRRFRFRVYGIYLCHGLKSIFAIEMERSKREQTNDFLVYNVNIEIRNREMTVFVSFRFVSSCLSTSCISMWLCIGIAAIAQKRHFTLALHHVELISTTFRSFLHRFFRCCCRCLTSQADWMRSWLCKCFSSDILQSSFCLNILSQILSVVDIYF